MNGTIAEPEIELYATRNGVFARCSIHSCRIQRGYKQPNREQ